jgi:hypothetical protein
MGSVSLGFEEVKWLGPDPQLQIALHSPDAVLETGLQGYLSEKSRHGTAFNAEESVLCSPVCLGIIAKYGHLSRVSRERSMDFLCSADWVAERVRFEPALPF